MSSPPQQTDYHPSFTSRPDTFPSINHSTGQLPQLNYERLFYSKIARTYFLDPSPNILICGPSRSGKTSIIDVMFYKASPHETLSYHPSNGTCVHSINHTPLFRCTVIDLVNTNNSSNSFNLFTDSTDKTVLNGPYFSSHSSTSAFTSTSHYINDNNHFDQHSLNSSQKIIDYTQSEINPKIWNLESSYGNSNSPNKSTFEDLSYNEKPFDELFFKKIASIIFIVDAQKDPLGYDLTQAKDIFKRAWKYNPDVKFEVFIHKVDGDFFATDEVRSQCQRAIHDKLMTFLDEEKVKNADVMFYSTSIYDHTIFEAFSRVMQNLAKNLSAYSQLLDTLVAKCKMERAFLLDSHTKAFIATDSSSFDPFNYELCSEIIDVMAELSFIYGSNPATQTFGNEVPQKSKVSREHNKDEAYKASNSSDLESIDGPPPSCLISLTSGHILYLKEIDKFVSLACTIREDNFDRQYLIDYNIKVFKEALSRLSQLSN